MKFLITFSLLLTMSVAFSQTCKEPVNGSFSKAFDLSKSSLSASCVATREQYKCAELEKDILDDEKEKVKECQKKNKEEIARCVLDEENRGADDREKVIRCDMASLEANTLGNMGISQCVFNGFLATYENLEKFAVLIAEGVVKSFHEQKACNLSVEKKREMLTTFNLTIPDERFKMNESMLGSWLENASCAEIDQQLFSRYQNYEQQFLRERKAAIDTGKTPAALKESGKTPDVLKIMKHLMETAEMKFDCYTPKAKAEMMCTLATQLFLDISMNLGVKGAYTKLAAMIRSKKALAAIDKAILAGEKLDLKHAGKLLKGDRIKAAELLLKTTFKGEEGELKKKAIQAAHEIGEKEGRGFFTYTPEDLRKKAKLLKEAGFKPDEIDLLMRNGVAGQFSANEARAGVMSKIRAAFKSDPKKAEQLAGDFEKEFTYLSKYGTDDKFAASTRIRIIADKAAVYDQKAAKGFYQQSMDLLKEELKKPNGKKPPVSDLLDLAGRAGDQDLIKKNIKDYVKQQQLDGPAALKRFTDEIAELRSKKVKNPVAIESAIRKRAAVASEFGGLNAQQAEEALSALNQLN